MSAAWIIYFAGVANGISTLCIILAMLCGAITFIFGGCWLCDGSKEARLPAIVSGILMVFSLIGAVFIPSKDTIYLMAGAKVTEDIVKSPEAKEIGGKILTIINDKLDEQVKGKK